jgi:putative oxidoreductase
MITELLFLIGRVIFGAYWIMAGYGHIKNTTMLAGYAQSKGVSAKLAKPAVIGSGVLALLGGLSILFGIWVQLGIILLVIFLLGVSFQIHSYWKLTDPHAKMADMVQFNKNMALLGALLMIFVIAGVRWHYSL